VKTGVVLVPHELLKSHEQIDQRHVRQLLRQIQQDGFIDEPVIIDRHTMIILDGHHRCAVAKALGLKKIPVYFVDYQCPTIKVGAWREGEQVTKSMVIRAGLAGPLFKPKTSRHCILQRPHGLKILLKFLK